MAMSAPMELDDVGAAAPPPGAADDGAVLHMQRRIFLSAGEDGAELPGGPRPAARRGFVDGGGAGAPEDRSGAGTLGGILFQPIAGDASLTLAGAVGGETTVRGVHFGILDAECIARMSVVTVTTPASKEQAGCLSDLRMGASSVPGCRPTTPEHTLKTPAALTYSTSSQNDLLAPSPS